MESKIGQDTKTIEEKKILTQTLLSEKILRDFKSGQYHIFFAIAYLFFDVILIILNGEGFVFVSLLSGTVFIFLAILSAVLYLMKFETSKSPVTLIINSFPFFILWISYELMSKIKENLLYPRVLTKEIYLLEMKIFGWIFGGMTPNQWFHSILYSVPIDLILGGIYLLHAFVPLVFGLYLYFKGDEKNFKFLVITFYTVTLLSFILFVSFPAAAPWYISQYGFIQPDITANYTHSLTAGLGRIDEILGVNIFSWYYGTFEQNSFAAFPSVHAVYALSATLCIHQKWKKSLYLTIPYSMAICLGAIYFNHHFIIDILCGVVISVIGHLVALSVKKKLFFPSSRA
ncbi:MAG: phosphatase PAP2 family protein [Candidatus Heimdallarchaeaceae archaeon]